VREEEDVLAPLTALTALRVARKTLQVERTILGVAKSRLDCARYQVSEETFAPTDEKGRDGEVQCIDKGGLWALLGPNGGAAGPPYRWGDAAAPPSSAPNQVHERFIDSLSGEQFRRCLIIIARSRRCGFRPCVSRR